MLGLTANCAKCHDHKYDPISHVEYYQLRAIFEPYQLRTEAVRGQLDHEKDGIPRPFDCNLDAETFLPSPRRRPQSRTRPFRIEPTVPAVVPSSVAMRVEPVDAPVPRESAPVCTEFVVRPHRQRGGAARSRPLRRRAAARTKPD